MLEQTNDSTNVTRLCCAWDAFAVLVGVDDSHTLVFLCAICKDVQNIYCIIHTTMKKAAISCNNILDNFGLVVTLHASTPTDTTNEQQLNIVLRTDIMPP
jgi:hypothetical protein